ncbi:hypothetical protein [Endozoicomonas ascidiicola]|nr:hypothetical protein [Endozoicomonas ascidiicola]
MDSSSFQDLKAINQNILKSDMRNLNSRQTEWVAADTRKTSSFDKIDELISDNKKPAIVMIDIKGCKNKNGSDELGSMSRILGLLEFAKSRNLHIFHIEIKNVEEVIPPSMKKYDKYHKFNKVIDNKGIQFSAYPTIKSDLKNHNIDTLFITGYERLQCAGSTAFGEKVKLKPEIKEGSGGVLSLINVLPEGYE